MAQPLSIAARSRKALVAVLDSLSLKSATRRAVQQWRTRRVPKIRPRIIRVLPHDPDAFTQGLCYWAGHLYESTGLVGRTSVRCIDPVSGVILRNVPVQGVWGEGIAVRDGRLVQLSYTDGIANILSVPGLASIGTYRYSGEGWGLATCGNTFMMTDGTDTILVRDGEFTEVGRLAVRIGNTPLRGLNDLVSAAGRIYANVYYDDSIYEIACDDGQVSRVVNCADLVRRERLGNAHRILNGIAYAADRGTFFVTGKHWRHIYEIAIDQPAIVSGSR